MDLTAYFRGVDNIKTMVTTHPSSLSTTGNPVYSARGTFSEAQLEHVLGQYTLFPKHIVAFLMAAESCARLHNCPGVADELRRNIGEEQGSQTGGVSHYDLLVRGIKSRTGVDVTGVQPADATRRFLADMPFILASGPSRYYQGASRVLGAAYCIEVTACPELELVRALVERYFTLATGSPDLGADFQLFFDKHLGIWEPGHVVGLEKTCAQVFPYIHLGDFRAGAWSVLQTMDHWWNGLYHEARII